MAYYYIYFEYTQICIVILFGNNFNSVRGYLIRVSTNSKCCQIVAGTFIKRGKCLATVSPSRNGGHIFFHIIISTLSYNVTEMPLKYRDPVMGKRHSHFHGKIWIGSDG